MSLEHKHFSEGKTTRLIALNNEKTTKVSSTPLFNNNNKSKVNGRKPLLMKLV